MLCKGRKTWHWGWHFSRFLLEVSCCCDDDGCPPSHEAAQPQKQRLEKLAFYKSQNLFEPVELQLHVKSHYSQCKFVNGTKGLNWEREGGGLLIHLFFCCQLFIVSHASHLFRNRAAKLSRTALALPMKKIVFLFISFLKTRSS